MPACLRLQDGAGLKGARRAAAHLCLSPREKHCLPQGSQPAALAAGCRLLHPGSRARPATTRSCRSCSSSLRANQQEPNPALGLQKPPRPRRLRHARPGPRTQSATVFRGRLLGPPPSLRSPGADEAPRAGLPRRLASQGQRRPRSFRDAQTSEQCQQQLLRLGRSLQGCHRTSAYLRAGLAAACTACRAKKGAPAEGKGRGRSPRLAPPGSSRHRRASACLAPAWAQDKDNRRGSQLGLSRTSYPVYRDLWCLR